MYELFFQLENEYNLKSSTSEYMSLYKSKTFKQKRVFYKT